MKLAHVARLFGLGSLLLSQACRDSTNAAGGFDDAGDAGAFRPDTSVRPAPDAGEDGGVFPAPTLSRVSPSSGSEAGGTRVTLRGTSFVEPVRVFFGSAEATSVVFLDEVSVAAMTPPGAVGRVTVRVETPGGTAELPDGFSYRRAFEITSIDPARVPEEGGVHVVVRGKGFDDATILLFDRQPLRGAVRVDDTRIEGWVPALSPGRPEVWAFHADADAKRSDLVTVFATPQIRAIAPGFGPIGTRVAIELVGDGFEGADRVIVGASAASDLDFVDADRIAARALQTTVGVVDVTVANADASATMSEGWVAYDPADAALGIVGVVPRRVAQSAAEIVRIIGNGFVAGARVEIAGREGAVSSVSPHEIEVAIPSGLGVGVYDVDVLVPTSSTTERTVRGTAMLHVFAPIEVASITPRDGPASGGTAVTIRGTGFVEGAVVRIADVPLADVVWVSANELRGTTVAGSHGAYDVEVRSSDTVGALSGGFRFEEPFEVVRIEPVEGSISGNTYVSILGRGLEGVHSVAFDGVDGVEPVVENGSVLAIRTPASPAAAVDVDVTTPRGDAHLGNGFQYFDPRLVTGGGWGGSIDGAVNVSVLSYEGEPMAGMLVQLGYDADLRYARVTDENGIATISSPEIRGAQTITVGAPNVEFVTFQNMDVRNVTMIAGTHPQNSPPDAPVSPCPLPSTPPIISGRIHKFKSSLDPETNPDWFPVAVVTYTQSNVFSPNPADQPSDPPPPQVAQVFADGGEYAISTRRVGTVAVYAVLGDYNTATGEFVPRRMGIARSVPVAMGTVTEDIDISLDIPLDQSVMVRMSDLPRQVPGPSLNVVFTYLNLHSDGVIPPDPFTWPMAFVESGDVPVTNLPAVSESQFFYMGGSFTFDGEGLSAPYTLNLLESGADFAEGIDLGPFLDMPQNMSPREGELIENGRFAWDQGGLRPDVTVMNVQDVRLIGGQCCEDANQNGTCEVGEKIQSGMPMPMGFNRWSIYAPGGLASYAMPEMPLGLEAFEPPRLYGYMIQQAIAPRHNWHEFTFAQFSPFFWRSWSVWQSMFLVKEATD